MISPFKFDDFVSASKTACKPDCTHCRFGTTITEPYHLGRRNPVYNLFCQNNLVFSWSTVSCTYSQLIGNLSDNLRVCMSQNQRTICKTIVNISFSVYICKLRTSSTFNEKWIRFESAHWRVYTTRKVIFRFIEQFFRIHSITL